MSRYLTCAVLQAWAWPPGCCRPPPAPTATPPSTPPTRSTPSCSPGRRSGPPSCRRGSTCTGEVVFLSFPAAVTELCCRLVESQRLESLRQAEARATSFLSSFSKGEKLKCQAPCRPLLLCYVYVPLCIIYCDDYTAIRVLVHCIERAGDMQLHSSLAADGQYLLFSVSALSVRPRPAHSAGLQRKIQNGVSYQGPFFISA